MKIARLTGIAFIAVLAMGLIVASAAFAEPEFSATGVSLSTTGGPSTLTADNGVEIVKCLTNQSGGTISSKTLVGGVVIHFLSCTAEESATKKTCLAHSSGAPAENLILTTTLHGVLGLILPKTGTGVGLLLLPATGSKFVTIEGSCITGGTVTGNVAGEVSPIGSKQTTGKLTFATSGGKQAIKDFDLSTGGLVAPKLTAFGTEGTEEALSEAITFGSAVEVS